MTFVCRCAFKHFDLGCYRHEWANLIQIFLHITRVFLHLNTPVNHNFNTFMPVGLPDNLGDDSNKSNFRRVFEGEMQTEPLTALRIFYQVMVNLNLFPKVS